MVQRWKSEVILAKSN